MPYKRSPSPAQQQWQSNRGNYWSGQQKMSYHSPYMQNNNYNVSNALPIPLSTIIVTMNNPPKIKIEKRYRIDWIV